MRFVSDRTRTASTFSFRSRARLASRWQNALMAAALASVLASCSIDDAANPLAPPHFAPSLSMEATSTMQTCERFGEVQTQSSCMQIKSLAADLRLLALEEATRLKSQFGFSNDCHQIGIAIEQIVQQNRVYEVPYRFVDPVSGNTATGDFHPAVQELPDEVHISRGWDALNPDRGPDAIKETFRHELAHSIGVHHSSIPTTDQVASLCGTVPGGGGGIGGPPTGPEHPTALPSVPILF